MKQDIVVLRQRNKLLLMKEVLPKIRKFNSQTEILELSDEVKRYKIEINVIDGGMGKEITILGILVS